MQCEGFRRRGGAFTLGPIRWEQCENDAIVIITVTQDGKTEQLPACATCWQEAIDTRIKISAAEPLGNATQRKSTGNAN